MLKITLKLGSGFNATINDQPVELSDLKLGADTMNKIDEMVHSLREFGCDKKIVFLICEKGVITFYKRLAGLEHLLSRDDSSTQHVPVFLSSIPVGLLSYLKEMESALLPLYSEDAEAR